MLTFAAAVAMEVSCELKLQVGNDRGNIEVLLLSMVLHQYVCGLKIFFSVLYIVDGILQQTMGVSGVPRNHPF